MGNEYFTLKLNTEKLTVEQIAKLGGKFSEIRVERRTPDYWVCGVWQDASDMEDSRPYDTISDTAPGDVFTQEELDALPVVKE